MDGITSKELELSPRDVVILKARLAYPDASVREIRDRLEGEYDISLSHNRVNEILREMRDEELFKQPVLPDESFLEYYRCELSFEYANFEDNWEACYDTLLADPHVVTFFEAVGTHHWELTTAFLSDGQAQSWFHDLFAEYGDLIDEFERVKLPTVHKNRVDAGILDDLLAATDEGQEYLDRTPESTEAVVPDGGTSDGDPE